MVKRGPGDRWKIDEYYTFLCSPAGEREKVGRRERGRADGARRAMKKKNVSRINHGGPFWGKKNLRGRRVRIALRLSILYTTNAKRPQKAAVFAVDSAAAINLISK